MACGGAVGRTQQAERAQQTRGRSLVRLLGSTALVGICLATLAAAALAEGTGGAGGGDNGGGGGNAGQIGAPGDGPGPGGSGGNAGTAPPPQQNANGTNGSDGENLGFGPGGGGGGGGGFSRQFNGSISTPVQGGDGGSGGAGGSGNGGGGGGGAGGDGALVLAPSLVTVSATVTGGNGGHGGDSDGGSAGGGGGGGAGVVLQTSNGLAIIAAVTGGNGGGGGHILTMTGTPGGGGGGGAGVILEQGGSLTIQAAAVTGGDGGPAGNTSGRVGSGGSGVIASDSAIVTVTVGGTVAGGKASGFGSGGAGLDLSAGGGTVLNFGTIRGGDGGAPTQTGLDGAAGGTGSGGATGFRPNTALPGGGGVGIRGKGLSVVNSGIIAGGTSTSGQADAITFTGGTNRLELRVGSTITGNVVAFSAADTLALGGATNGAFDVEQIGAAAQYRGFGLFEKTGTSTFTLTGTNTAALPWTVNGGTLLVNGSIANSTMTVNAGGTLGGTGTIGATAINGGTLSPGNSIGTITVASLTLTAASSYLVEVSPAAADRTDVDTTATLAGTVNAVFAPGSYVARNYTILSATGGLGGTQFGALATTNLPVGFDASLSYVGNNVLLNLVAQLGMLPSDNLNRNQQNVATALNDFFNSGGTLPPGFVTVFGLTGPTLGNALTQLSGEHATGIQQASNLSTGMFLNAMLDPFVAGRSGGFGAAMAYAPDAREAYAADMPVKAPPLGPSFEQRWSVWGSAYGGQNRTDGDPVVGSNDLRATAGGFAAGADYRVSPSSVIGAAVAIGETRWNVSGLGKGDADVAQIGGYASTRWDALYVSGAVALGWHRAATDRTVTIAGTDRLEADFNATSWGGRLEGGYRYGGPAFGITPYAAVQMQGIQTSAYSEVATAGSNQFALSYGDESVTDTRSELGAWLDSRHALASGAYLILRGRRRLGARLQPRQPHPGRVPDAAGRELCGGRRRRAARRRPHLGGGGITHDQRRIADREIRRRVRQPLAHAGRHRHAQIRVVAAPLVRSPWRRTP
jgi:outer membrane autotransporter protein